MLSDRPAQSGAAGTRTRSGASGSCASPARQHRSPCASLGLGVHPLASRWGACTGVWSWWGVFWPMVLRWFARAEHGILQGDSKEAFSRCEGGVNAQIGVQR